jgi:hypothetical protein
MRRALAIIVVASFAAACGGTGSELTTPLPASSPTQSAVAVATASSSQHAVKQTVQNYLTAFFNGDTTTAYRTLSRSCRSKFTKAKVKALSDQIRTTYGVVHQTSVTVRPVNSKKALVSYTLSVPGLNANSQSWIYQNGGWRLSTC